VQFVPGDPDIGSVALDIEDELGRRIGREPLLGAPALLAQLGQRLDRRGSGGVDLVGETWRLRLSPPTAA